MDAALEASFSREYGRLSIVVDYTVVLHHVSDLSGVTDTSYATVNSCRS